LEKVRPPRTPEAYLVARGPPPDTDKISAFLRRERLQGAVAAALDRHDANRVHRKNDSGRAWREDRQRPNAPASSCQFFKTLID
jgi:hypothetical protein